jgi:hypothetical protein
VGILFGDDGGPDYVWFHPDFFVHDHKTPGENRVVFISGFIYDQEIIA